MHAHGQILGHWVSTPRVASSCLLGLCNAAVTCWTLECVLAYTSVSVNASERYVYKLITVCQAAARRPRKGVLVSGVSACVLRKAAC